MAAIGKGLKFAYDSQEIAHETLQSFRQTLKIPTGQMQVSREDAHAIADLVRSLDIAQERVRIHRLRVNHGFGPGVPKPRPRPKPPFGAANPIGQPAPKPAKPQAAVNTPMPSVDPVDSSATMEAQIEPIEPLGVG